jgi:hypothetical protein
MKHARTFLFRAFSGRATELADRFVFGLLTSGSAEREPLHPIILDDETCMPVAKTDHWDSILGLLPTEHSGVLAINGKLS